MSWTTASPVSEPSHAGLSIKAYCQPDLGRPHHLTTTIACPDVMKESHQPTIPSRDGGQAVFKLPSRPQLRRPTLGGRLPTRRPTNPGQVFNVIQHKPDILPSLNWGSAKSLFEALPSTQEDWTESRKTLGFLTSEDIWRTVNEIMLRNNAGEPHQELAKAGKPGLLPYLERFGDIANQQRRDQPRATMIFRFRCLVFLALCQIALTPEPTLETQSQVYTILESFLNGSVGYRKKRTPTTLRQYIRTPSWVMARSDELSREANFGHRGYEIIVYGEEANLNPNLKLIMARECFSRKLVKHSFQNIYRTISQENSDLSL